MKTKILVPLLGALACAAGLLLFVRPPATPTLQAQPTEAAESLDLPDVFPRPVVWLGNGPLSTDDTARLIEAATARPGDGPREAITRLEMFVQAFPQSGWVPSVREALAEHYSERLHYEQAMEHWADNLQTLRAEVAPERKAAADRALALLTRHLLIAGRVEELGPLLEEFRGRTLDEGPLSAMRIRTAQKYRRTLKYPWMSYKCGVFALDRLAVSQGWQYSRQALRDEPSGPAGLSLLDLQKIAGKHGLQVLPVRATQPGLLPVPSVMHTRLGHYVTLLQQREGELFVFDPGAKQELWVPLDDVVEEATGHFLVPGLGVPRGTVALDAVQADQVRGRTTSCPPNHAEAEDCDGEDEVEWNDGADPGDGGQPEGCPSCEDEEPSCCGAAIAVVRRGYLEVFFKDRPLVYRPSKGPIIFPKVRFKRYNESFNEGFYPSLAGNWRLAWRSGLGPSPGGDLNKAIVYINGGTRTYTFSGPTEPMSLPHGRDGSFLLRADGSQPWTLVLGIGRKIEYAGPTLQFAGIQASRLVNRFGLSLELGYDGNGRLSTLTDADGKVTFLDYATFFGQTRLWKIRTPDNRAAVFNYVQTEAGNVLLASITDANGLVSSFTYPDSQSPNFPYAEGVPHTLTTPYGTRSFDYASGQTAWDDFVTVTDPAGTKRAYGLMSYTSLIPAFAANQLPVGAPDPDTGDVGQSTIDTTYREYDNTFYWGPAAMQTILAGPNPNPDNWGWAEMKRAQITRWLVDPNWYSHVTDIPNHV